MADVDLVKTGLTQPRGRAGRPAALGFIFGAALMDVVALGIIIPVLPPLIQQMAGGSTAAALHYVFIFSTTWATMQFIAAPIIGALSDRFGRRPVLLISIFGLAIDYVIMALAPNLAWLFVGRIISGVTAASFSTAGAYIADVSAPEERAQNFGLIGSAFGLGFVLGPFLGGLLGQVDPRLPFWAAAGLGLINGLYGLFVLPESLPPERRSPFRWRNANPLGSLRMLAAYPGLLGLGGVFFLFMLGQQALNSIFVLYTTYRFHWTTGDMGLYLGATGAGSILVQSFVVKPAVRMAGERGALLIGLLAGAVGFAIFALAPSSPLFWCGLPVFALVGLVQPATQALMSRRVPADEQGRLQGANAGIMSITGLIGPGLYTTVFAWAITDGAALGLPGLGILLASVLAVAAIALAARYARPVAEAI